MNNKHKHLRYIHPTTKSSSLTAMFVNFLCQKKAHYNCCGASGQCLFLVLWQETLLLVKCPVVDRIHPQNNMFAMPMGVEHKGTADSKLNERSSMKRQPENVT